MGSNSNVLFFNSNGSTFTFRVSFQSLRFTVCVVIGQVNFQKKENTSLEVIKLVHKNPREVHSLTFSSIAIMLFSYASETSLEKFAEHFNDL